MIERSERRDRPAFRIVGLGNAGVNLADRIAMEDGIGDKVIAVNTDAQSVASSMAGQRISIASRATRGLGTGGDPDLAAAAAEEHVTSIRDALTGVDLVILCAGLGGGTGSGASVLLAEAAREAGAFVVALVTLPFAFEGRRRAKLATEAATALAEKSDVLLAFENDRMAELNQPLSSVVETFARSDEMICDAVRGFLRMTQLDGVLRASLGDIRRVLGSQKPATLSGFAVAEGGNRAHEAVERAIKHPLVGGAARIKEADALLVHLTASPDFTLAETNAAFGMIEKLVPKDCALALSLSVDQSLHNALSVVLMGADGLLPREREKSEETNVATNAQSGNVARSEKRGASRGQRRGEGQRARQGTLEFEPVARGRFEKSEPTIIEGEDLDVPTFLRLKMKLK